MATPKKTFGDLGNETILVGSREENAGSQYLRIHLRVSGNPGRFLSRGDDLTWRLRFGLSGFRLGDCRSLRYGTGRCRRRGNADRQYRSDGSGSHAHRRIGTKPSRPGSRSDDAIRSEPASGLP